MKTRLALLSITAILAIAPGVAQTVTQDLKKAGSETKDAAKDVGHATKSTARKVKGKTKQTVHKTSSKVANKTEGH
jgi:gas vesicle protein